MATLAEIKALLGESRFSWSDPSPWIELQQEFDIELSAVGAAASHPPAPPYVPTVVEIGGRREAPPTDDEAFIAAETDSSLVVDVDGVVLTLHAQGLPWDQIETDEDVDVRGAETEVPWSEIADVTHHLVSRARLAVRVTLHDGSSFEGEINARRTSRAQQWQRDLAEAGMRYLVR
ncbi:hypothetical protein [Streptomyces sp. NPDC058657]|uniref:hypothetical protein n=1 Tax=unclassified Streptomyces TaxID=2593676 RepID=UPI0036634ED4